MTKQFENEEVKFFTPQPLKLDLQYFSDGGENSEGDDPNQSQQGDNGQSQGDNTNSHEGNKSGDAHKQDNMIPKSRFDEVNNKFKDVQTQLDQLLKEKQDQELEQQKQRGEYEELYKDANGELERYKQEHGQYSERVEQLEGVIQTMVEAKLSEIPEDFHDIIPDGMSPEQKLQWISNAQAKGLFGAQTNPKEDQPLGDNTNNNGDKHVDVSKMSATELFMSAYGRKEK